MAVAKTLTESAGVNAAVTPQSAPGLLPTVQNYLALEAERKRLVTEVGKLESKAKTLHKALVDAVEVAGGMLEAGTYILALKEGARYPKWKEIAERIVKENGLDPSTCDRMSAETPPSVKLEIA